MVSIEIQNPEQLIHMQRERSRTKENHTEAGLLELDLNPGHA